MIDEEKEEKKDNTIPNEHPVVCDCEQLKKQAEEYKAGWQRALADYKNLQKEVAARRSELVAMSELQILEEFIPVYDNFKLAFGLRTTDYSPEQKNWIDGIGHIMKQFGDILKAHGVEEIKTVGEKFDPRLHEAVGEEDVPSAYSTGLKVATGESRGAATLGASATLPETGTILRELSGGYTMKGRVIKPAKVIVSK